MLTPEQIKSRADALTIEQVNAMARALGWPTANEDQSTACWDDPYRNHYIISPRTEHMWWALARCGMAILVTGGSQQYWVTDLGIEVTRYRLRRAYILDDDILSPEHRLQQIRDRLAETTPGPWFVATGCSWRRILQQGTDDGVVLPTNHPHDHHPDLMARPEDLTFILCSYTKRTGDDAPAAM